MELKLSDAFQRENEEEGKEDALLDLVKDGLLTKEQAAERLDISIEQIEEKLQEKYKK